MKFLMKTPMKICTYKKWYCFAFLPSLVTSCIALQNTNIILTLCGSSLCGIMLLNFDFDSMCSCCIQFSLAFGSIDDLRWSSKLCVTNSLGWLVGWLWDVMKFQYAIWEFALWNFKIYETLAPSGRTLFFFFVYGMNTLNTRK